MKTLHTDFLIIGSGFGAIAPALRLCQKGQKVLLIEKGKNIRGKEDFRQTQDPKHLQQYLKSLSSKNISFTYAEGTGGGSGFYEMVSLRAPSLAFTQKALDGRPLWDNEINRSTLDPYYNVAEDMLNVTQIPEEKIPKSGAAFSLLMKNLGYSCDRARYAVKNCLGSGYCISGCIFGAKQSLHYNYIPAAEKNGLKIISGMEAISIQPLLSTKSYNYKIQCKSFDQTETMILAKTVILGGGTVGSAKILLKSKEYLPGLSEEVGKNICFNGSVKTAGLLSDDLLEGDMLSGMTHPGMISYHFLESMGITISTGKPSPLSLVASHQLTIKGESKDGFWGKANVDLMKSYRHKMIALYTLGFSPQTAEIQLLRNKKFRSVLKITPALTEYYNKSHALLESILIRNNCKVLEVQKYNSKWEENKNLNFSTAHMTGSCRMSSDIKTGVVNSNCEVFGYPNLFITDGAVIPSSLAVNTSLTILANAERVSDYLVRRFS
jgi:cholesterol oxidase